MRISLDTNVFVSIHNKERDSSSCELILNTIEKNKWNSIISVISVSEMLVGYYNQRNFTKAEQFLVLIQKNYDIQPINLQIAQLGAKYRSQFKLKLPDALILASGVYKKVDILISNDIDMQKSFPIQVVSVSNFIEQYIEEK